ncbi:MAG: sterol desaturase family protein [Cyclobacteriaceae bacterium]|nr:sterol desaturase family protein [Cyclobacteriaceae bacterium]
MNLNPIVLSIPIFFILIGIELVVERFSHRTLYRLPDAIANLSCGITSQLSGLFMRVLAIGVYEVLYSNFAFFELNRTVVYWIALFLLTDFAYYWAHRMSHEINLFWGGHVVHHQSEEYNLSVALRQSSFQVVWTFAFSLPIALLGFNTLDFALMSALNTLYQFWIHTETINKMGWFEYIFNTPSHHRVHHGRNPKYIDKNHAGSLIIWDKMFGTFQAEEERPTYGITKPINSWNAIWANFSHYAVMADEMKQIPSWSDKFKYLFKKPGWLPESLGGYRAAPEVDKSTYRKFDTSYPMQLNYYVLFQYILCLFVTGLFLFKQTQFALTEKAIAAALISLWVVNSGVLFESKQWVIVSEWIRIVSFSLLVIAGTYWLALPDYSYAIALMYGLVSGVWFKLVSNLKNEKRVAV